MGDAASALMAFSDPVAALTLFFGSAIPGVSFDTYMSRTDYGVQIDANYDLLATVRGERAEKMGDIEALFRDAGSKVEDLKITPRFVAPAAKIADSYGMRATVSYDDTVKGMMEVYRFAEMGPGGTMF